MSAPPATPSRPLSRIAALAVAAASAATAAAILVGLVLPGWAVAALRGWLLVVGAIAACAAIGAIVQRFPVHRRSPLDPTSDAPPAAGERPPRLREIDRLVAHAAWDEADYRARLRPVLREIAAQRLAAYRTIDIEAEPDAARAALGEQVWAFLAPADPATARRDHGIDLDDLRLTVETLEGLDDVDSR